MTQPAVAQPVALKVVRVLFLSGTGAARSILFEGCVPDVKLELVLEEALGNPDSYSITAELCEKIAQKTSDGSIDLVVVGDNLGCGLGKVRHINKKLKTKTIVYWESYRPGSFQDSEYFRLGPTRFCSAADLPSKIEDALKAHDTGENR